MKRDEYQPLAAGEESAEHGRGHGIIYEASPAPGGHAPAPAASKSKPLTLWPLVALIFFEVSGGPFGTEVSAASRRRSAWPAMRSVQRATPWPPRPPAASAGLLHHGMQDAVAAGGPLLVLLGFLVLPLVWSVPEALITAGEPPPPPPPSLGPAAPPPPAPLPSAAAPPGHPHTHAQCNERPECRHVS
jgi:hypothetical protein